MLEWNSAKLWLLIPSLLTLNPWHHLRWLTLYLTWWHPYISCMAGVTTVLPTHIRKKNLFWWYEVFWIIRSAPSIPPCFQWWTFSLCLSLEPIIITRPLLWCFRPSVAWPFTGQMAPKRAVVTAAWGTKSPAALPAPLSLCPSASPRRSTTNRPHPTAVLREMATPTQNPVSTMLLFVKFSSLCFRGVVFVVSCRPPDVLQFTYR